MTYGALKFRLTKMFPGVDADLIEGWIGDRYSEILAVLPWSRSRVQAILQTTAPYSAGTVALTAGSASVTLTGGTFTTAMTGRAFRVTGRDEFYEFTFSGALTGVLDRPYSGSTNAAASYTIWQPVYPMPEDCRMLEDDAFGSFKFGDVVRVSRTELNRWTWLGGPWTGTTDGPLRWCSYMDDGSTPPRMQVELSPIPNPAVSIPFTYIADGTPLTSTSQILQVWLQPGALLEGVISRVKAHLRDYVGAQTHEGYASKALAVMVGAEAQGMGPSRMQLDSYYTRHRSGRANR